MAEASATKVNTRWITPISTPDSLGQAAVNASNANGEVMRSDDEATVEAINYVAYGIIANIIVGVGIIGNILNLIVLTRPKLKGVMYVYLLGLAVSNLCVLIIAIPALMDIAGNINSQNFITAFFQAHMEIPLLNSFMASSVYIIICMTVNRYISIYKPTHFQRIHTFKNAYLAIFFSFLGGVVLHIPLAFEHKVLEQCEVIPSPSAVLNLDGSQEGDKLNEEAPALREVCIYLPKTNDSIVNHALFRVYLWISESLLRFGPIITLTILNILIIVRFHRIAMKREVLKGGGTKQSHRGSNGGTNPPPSPFTNGSNANLSSNGGRLSVCTTTANGRLSIPNGAIPITDDRTTSFAYGQEVTMTTTCTQITASSVSRANTPLPMGSNGNSPSRTPMIRGTPCRHSSKRRGLHNPEERMLVVVLIAIVILFVVCTTPAAFLSILVTDQLKRTVWFSVFRACANNLELLCFALNFFVYCLCSADIRRAFVDVLFENVVVKYVRRRSTFKANGIEMATINAIQGADNV